MTNYIQYFDKNGENTSKLSEAERIFFGGDDGTGDSPPEDFTNLPKILPSTPYKIDSLESVGYLD